MTKIERILVATDFSEPAERAVQTAVDLAREFEARLEIVHAVETPVPLFEPYSVSLPAGIVEGVRKAATAKLDVLEGAITSQGVQVETLLLEVPAAAHIGARAATFGADLVVVGTRGVGTLKRVLLGSTAERVVRECACSVLTVKGEAPAGHPQRILVGTDFSEPAGFAVGHAASLARALGATLHLAHAVDLEVPIVGPYELSVPQALVEQAREAAAGQLAALADELRAEGELAIETVVLVGAGAQALCVEAESIGADWLVVGTHGRSGISRFLLGSVAERTLREAPCSVLTVHQLSV